MTLTLDRTDIKPKSLGKVIENLTLLDFDLNISQLTYAHTIVFIDEETKQSHTIR